MKQLKFTLLAFIAFFAMLVNVNAQCNYTISLVDTFGDGWNGGVVTVQVNGVDVLTDLTIIDGFGPEVYDFTVSDGDAITTVYTVGSFGGENEYYVYDAEGNEIFSDGTGGTTPAGGSVGTATCPSCIMPGALGAVPGSETEVELAWTDVNGASEWQIEYDVSGYTQGLGITVSNVTTSTYLLTGLTASTTYDYYVRTVCAPGDTSAWSGPYTFSTPCPVVTTYPYTEDFDSGFLSECWTSIPSADGEEWIIAVPGGSGVDPVAYGASQDHTSGSGFVAWINDSETTLANPSSLETGVFDLTSLTSPRLVFWCWIGAYTNTSTLNIDVYDGSAWNTDVATVTANGSWIEIVVDLTPYASAATQIRFRANENDGDYQSDIAIDDVTIEETPIDEPDWCNLSSPATATVLQNDIFAAYAEVNEPGVTDAAGQGAGMEAWIGINIAPTDPSSWTYWIPASYDSDNGSNDVYVTNESVTLPVGTYYYASRFRLNGGPFVYGGFDGGFWDGTTNISGVLTVNEAPGNNCANPIVINLPADAPYLDAGQTTVGRVDDYTETCLGGYDGGEDIIYQLNITSDVMVNITLDPKTTTWTGIMIDNECPDADATCDNVSTSGTAAPHGFSNLNLTAGTYYIMIDTWPAPDNIADFDLSIEVITCPAPANLTANNLTNVSADLSWDETGTAGLYNIEYGGPGFTPGTGTTLTGVSNPYTLTGLTPESDYDYYVQADCGGGDVSEWTGPYTFTTLVNCPDPVNVVVSNIQPNSVDVDWDGLYATNWDIEYGVTPFTATGTPNVEDVTAVYSLTGLTEDTNYDLYVRADCGAGDESTWVGPINFTTQTSCLTPDNLVGNAISDTEIELNWDDFGTTTWDIEYGVSPYTATGTPTIEDVTANPYTLTGLAAETAYDVYVRTDCGAGTSNWFGPITVETQMVPLTNPTACGLSIWVSDQETLMIPVEVAGETGTLGTDMKLESFNFIAPHVFNGDLELSLMSPSGVVVDLTIANGGGSSDYGVDDGTCTQYTNLNMTGVDGLVSGGTGPFLGSYVPDGDFADFNDGTDPNGIWYILAYDNYVGDDGTLEYAELVFANFSAENDILTYDIPESTGPAVIDDVNHKVDIEVGWDTDKTALTASFTLSDFASAEVAGLTQESGVTVNDFTNPVTYDVIAENGDIQQWTVNVANAAAPSSDADILTYSLAGQVNSNIDDANNEIFVEMPFGTDLTSLVADFTLSFGATAEIGGTPQVSTVTANDFSAAVVYTVTAEDGNTTQDWTVYVDVLPADPGTDCSNPILASEGMNMADNSAGGQWFYFIAPVGGNVTVSSCGYTEEDTYLYFYETECGIEIDSYDDYCGYQSELSYPLNAGDTLIIMWGDDYTSGMYDWILEFELFNTEAEIITYEFAEQVAPAVIDQANGTIDVDVAYGTDLTTLVADFTLSLNASAEVAGVVQTSGTTANDFTTPVVYDVIAEDGITVKGYTVTVNEVAANTETDILTYSFPEATGPADIDNAAHTVNIEVGVGTDPSALVADFTLSYGATAEVATVPQVSGTTANDFSTAVTYTVTAEDGIATQDWQVTVTVATAPNTEADILTYSFPEATGPAVIDDVANTVDIEIAWDADITNLIADFTLSYGASADIAGTAQVSGTTVNDFTASVDYTVTAEDMSTTETWTVYVTVQAIPAGAVCETAIQAYEGINAADNSAGNQWFYYVADAIGEVTVTTCGLTTEDTYLYFYDTDCGAEINSEDDFCGYQSEMTYPMAIEDTLVIMWGDDYTSDMYDWEISFYEYSSEAMIIDYSFPEATGPAAIDDVNHTIDIEVDYGTDVTNLVADFTLSMGASAEISTVAQFTGTSVNDFSTPVVYTVIAEDGVTTIDWTVNVTVKTPVIVINEVDADQTGTDADEFIELFDGGYGNVALDGYTVVLYNGNGDISYDAIDLDGYTTDADGYFVIGSATTTNVDLAYFTTNGIQNGADGVALYADDAVNFPVGTAVTDVNLVDALVYDTNDGDDAELIAGLLNPGEPQINEDENGAKDTESMQRIPNGEGGLRNTSSYMTVIPTPGAVNLAPPMTDLEIGWMLADTTYECNLGYESVTILIINSGSENIPVDDTVFCYYNVNGGTPVADTFVVATEMTPGDIEYFTFDEEIDLSALGQYDYSLWIDYDNDFDATNNAFDGWIEHYQLTVEIAQGDTMMVAAGTYPVELSTIDSYDTIHWENEAGTLAGTNSTFNIYAPGWYFVEVNDYNGCPAVDSIFIEEYVPAANDIAITMPLSVDYTMCELTSTEAIMAEITNFGANPVTAGDTIFMHIQFMADPEIADTVVLSADLLPGESFWFTSGSTLDMSALGTYTWEMFAEYGDDLDLSNNTVSGSITHADLTVEIDAPDTVYAYAYEMPLSFTTVDSYDTYHWFNESETVHESGDWYETSEFGWHYVEVSNVNTECNLIDSVLIIELIPAATDLAIVDPESFYGEACDLGMEDMDITAMNVGSDPIPTGDSVFVYLEINGDVYEDTVVLAQDLNPGDSIVFDGPVYDMSALGYYDYMAYVYYEGDLNADNDTAMGLIEHIEMDVEIAGGDTIFAYAFELPILLSTTEAFDNYMWSNSDGTQDGYDPDFSAMDFGWYYVSVNNDGMWCMPTDSIYIAELTMENVDVAVNMHGITSIDLCDLGVDTLGFTVLNAGVDPIPMDDTVFVYYQVDGGAIVEDTLILPYDLLSGDEIDFEFVDDLYDFSALGLYSIDMWVSYDGDLNADNDLANIELNHIEYILDLDAVNGGIDDTLIVNSYPATLDAGANFEFYMWSTTEETQTIEVNADGWYYAAVYSTYGCYAEDSIFVTLEIGMEELPVETTVSVYPNPTRDNFNVVVTSGQSADITIELISLQGQLIYTNKAENVENYHEVINTTEFAKGVYYLRVNNGSDLKIEKVIVQ